MSEHIVSPKIYILIFAMLMILTITTVYAATVDLNAISHGLNIIVALVIATCKAILVMLFFMHAYYSSKRTQLIIICRLFLARHHALSDSRRLRQPLLGRALASRGRTALIAVISCRSRRRVHSLASTWHTSATFGCLWVFWKVGDGPEGLPGRRTVEIKGGRNEPAQPSIP